MASRNQGDPPVGQELDLSGEAPGAMAHEPPLEQFRIDFGLDGVGFAVATRSSLGAVLNWLILCSTACMVAGVSFGLCHVAGAPNRITGVVVGGLGVGALVAGLVYQRPHRR